jgi:hypothetical protein
MFAVCLHFPAKKDAIRSTSQRRKKHETKAEEVESKKGKKRKVHLS